MWGFRKKENQPVDPAELSYERHGYTEPTPLVESESALIARGRSATIPVEQRPHVQAETFLERFRAQRPAPAPAPVPKAEPTPAPQPAPAPAPKVEPAPAAPQPVPAPKPEPVVETTPQGLFARLRAGLRRTGGGLTEGLTSLFLGKKTIDDELLEELETRLLMADVGVEATQRILDSVTAEASRRELQDADALIQVLRQAMLSILEPCSEPLTIDPQRKPFVLLMVGVNGVGKTTTIGKLARRFQGEGRSVLLAAGDTFRAAAVEQLQAWGERSDIPVVAQETGADSASVIFDALQKALAREQDVLIADTAGRLHTQSNLMEELKKVKRVMGNLDTDAPHETLLVLDASNGQNALAQAKSFHEAIGVDGIVLTKLDGTAKGGVIFAIAEQLKLPIRFIGIGEKAEDLRPFEADQFVDALLSDAS